MIISWLGYFELLAGIFHEDQIVLVCSYETICLLNLTYSACTPEIVVGHCCGEIEMNCNALELLCRQELSVTVIFHPRY